MLRRSLAVLVLCLVAGCQDYNFNPVGRCVLQAASVSAPLANTAVADVLFVVDDSGSMAPQQASLARNFQAFIDTLTAAQNDRKARGLDPFEFHIAITTSSIFEAWQASGAPKCGTPSANTCSIQNPTFSWTAGYTYQCTTPGLDCPDVIPQYHNFSGCFAGVGVDKAPYPDGDFVAAAGNPRVLHFTKDAFDTTQAAADKLKALIAQFQQNVAVGTCGSGMEQHLEAGRRAVDKAFAGGQPGLASGEWPHAGAKMVVVWVGDEDDCSNPKTTDPTKTLYFTPTKQSPGNDVCTDEADPTITDPAKSRLFKISDYASYFTGLNRPFSAAFIYSAVNCRDVGNNRICDAGTCSCADFCPTGCTSCGPTATGNCNIPAECSGKSRGTRIHDLSSQLRDKNVTTIEATICDLNFAGPLQRIAQLVTEPPIPRLPTQPAASQVVQVRILSADGQHSRPCAGPPSADTDAARQASDWWFVPYVNNNTASCDNSNPPKFSLTPTQCVALNPNRASCIANPGETYIAQYIGALPEAVPNTDPAKALPAGCASTTECETRLSVKPGSVTCQFPDPTNPPTQPPPRGTCVCVP